MRSAVATNPTPSFTFKANWAAGGGSDLPRNGRMQRFSCGGSDCEKIHEGMRVKAAMPTKPTACDSALLSKTHIVRNVNAHPCFYFASDTTSSQIPGNMRTWDRCVNSTMMSTQTTSSGELGCFKQEGLCYSFYLELETIPTCQQPQSWEKSNVEELLPSLHNPSNTSYHYPSYTFTAHSLESVSRPTFHYPQRIGDLNDDNAIDIAIVDVPTDQSKTQLHTLDACPLVRKSCFGQ